MTNLNQKGFVAESVAFIAIVGFLIGLIAFSMWGLPKYGVYRRTQRGKAELAEAQFSKQTKLEEAKANLEAEKLNAQSEIERAKGAAESIKVEGGQLTDEYIKYLWVRNLENGKSEKIYIPTEAGLPILEARGK